MQNEIKSKEVILGLDISSRNVGVSVFGKEAGELLDLFAVVLPKQTITEYKDMFEKIEYFSNEICNRFKNQNWIPVEVRVEANAKAFSGGATTAQTMFVLAKMNALVVYWFWQRYPKATIKEIQVSTARKKIGFKQSKTTGKKIKEQVFDFVIANYSKTIESFLPTKILKSGPNKGAKVYDEHAKDMVDAFVIGKGV
jgi:hypothetical protein